MTDALIRSGNATPGDALLRVLGALANPHRLRVIALLAGGEAHVSALARTAGISRPLLQMHLQKLEAAGLVRSRLELGSEGRALRIYELAFTGLTVTPELIRNVAGTLSSVPAGAETD